MVEQQGMESGIVIALIASIGSILVTAVGGWFTYINNKRIDDLEDEVKDLQNESVHQKKTINRLKKYLKEWWDGIQCLLQQIGEVGLEPIWKPEQPPELDDDE